MYLDTIYNPHPPALLSTAYPESNAPAIDMAQFQDLPNKLLHEVARQVRGRYRNSTLVSLSLVCKKFQPIAQEAMLQRPCLQIANIHLFMLELGRHHWVIPRIQSLEFWSTDKGRRPRDGNDRVLIPYPLYEDVICSPELRALFNEQVCYGLMKRFSKGESHVQIWMKALKLDVVQAALGLLIVSLPNLKEFRCAALWLMDFPILSTVMSPEVDGIRPLGWESKHAFFTGVMEKLAPNLEVLEVPANLSCMRALGRPSSLFGFSSFTKLRQLSVSMDALYYHKRRLSLPSPWPVPLLPPNLRILRISESFLGTTIFVEDVCKVKKQGMSLQFLERVEVIYKYPYEIVIKAASDRNVADPVYDMGSFCLSAEIAISLYFPGVPMMTPHVNRSLWSLREFGEMTQIEWEV